MNIVNPNLTLTSPFPLIFPSNLSITNEAALVANLDKISLAQRTARSNYYFLVILPNVLPKSPLD